MLTLQKPFLCIENAGLKSYGGNQMLSDSAAIRKCGCGPVAALDTVLYLEQTTAPSPLSLPEYNRMLSDVTKRYFPLIPPFGINGLLFVLGINRLLHARNLPYRALWMLSGGKLWSRVEELLSKDIPVILSVGPNFPQFWQNNRLPFYCKTPNGEYRRVTATKGHYVTATGIDDQWLQISSWGKRYFINRIEYENYTRAHSNYAFSNLVYLYKRAER